MSEFGVDKGLLQSQARRKGDSCSDIPDSPVVFRKKFLKAKFGVRAAECVTFFWLVDGEVTGWCSSNLVLSLKLPSSTWVGALIPEEELKGIVMCIPWGGTRALSQGCTVVSWLFLPRFFIPSLPWLAAVWTCPLGIREDQGGWMKPISYRHKNGGHRKSLVPRRTPQGPAQFH